MGNFRLNKSLQRQNLPNRGGQRKQETPVDRSKMRVRPSQPRQLPNVFFDEQGSLNPYEACPPTPPDWDSNDWYATCIQDLGIEENYANLGLI